MFLHDRQLYTGATRRKQETAKHSALQHATLTANQHYSTATQLRLVHKNTQEKRLELGLVNDPFKKIKSFHLKSLYTNLGSEYRRYITSTITPTGVVSMVRNEGNAEEPGHWAVRNGCTRSLTSQEPQLRLSICSIPNKKVSTMEQKGNFTSNIQVNNEI